MSRRKGFCRTHDDLCWIYDDGSVQCMYDLVVETCSSDHDWVADPIVALCARHDITVEGIVALVDDTFSPDNDSWLAARHVSALRRLARGEEA